MEKFVIALGGSVILPEKIDIDFLKEFKDFLVGEMKKGKKFVLIIGGGKVCREYQKAASLISPVSNKDKDLLGIKVTRLNAELLKAVFGKYCHPVVLDERFKVRDFGKYSLIMGCGWEVGHSTDFDAVLSSVDFNIKTTIILGKPSYVYTSNPDEDKKAEPIERMNWKEYFKLVPSEWTPGFSSPVDITAAKLAEKENIEVIVAYGRDLDNFKSILEGKDFKGTLIA